MFLKQKIPHRNRSQVQVSLKVTAQIEHLNITVTLEFCQAQPQPQLSWAELVLFPTSPADDGDDTWNSTF